MSAYEIGPFTLDVEQSLLLRAGKPVALGPKVVQTLLALAERPGAVIAKNDLMERIWPEGFVEEANLSQNIHVLRRVFAAFDSADPIETVPRRGYRLTARVRRSPRAFSRRLAAAIASAVVLAASLVLMATYGSGQRALSRGALSPAGAQAYQVGTYYWSLRTRDGVRKSLTYFAKVIDTDPQNALGFTGLADANVAMGEYCYGTHLPDVYFARAHEYAERALALDPNSAQAYAVLGVIALNRVQMAEAARELEHAIALDANYAPAQEWYGIVLLRQNEIAASVVHLKVAAKLDPLSVSTTAWLGTAAYLDHRFSDAITYSKQALELSPKRVDVLVTMGLAYEGIGNLTSAIATYERYGALGNYYRPLAAIHLARVYARAHRMAEARAQSALVRAHASANDHHIATYT